MSLFQLSVLKKYLIQQDSTLVQNAYKKHPKYFHNGTIQEISEKVMVFELYGLIEEEIGIVEGS